MEAKHNLRLVVDDVLVDTKRTTRGYKGAIVGIQKRVCWHREKESVTAPWGKQVRSEVTFYVVCKWVKKGDDEKTKAHIAMLVKRGTMQEVRYVEAKAA